MSSSSTEYVYFHTKNYTGQYSTSGYALPISPFTFIPRLDDVFKRISNTRVLWNFGDGTLSHDVTATHTYLFPGKYNVTLFLYDSGGNALIDTFSQDVIVKNYVNDTLVLTTTGSAPVTNKTSYIENPITINRFNSWQTYNELSASNYTINLYASGSNAPLVDAGTYNSQAYIHLIPTAHFYTLEENVFTGNNEYVIASQTTTDVNEIYVRLQNGIIVECEATDEGAVLAGTWGTKQFYYTDDLPVTAYPAIVSVSFDLTHFDDPESFNKKIFKYVDRPRYQILQQVPEFVEFYSQIPTTTYSLFFTTNGIDGDGERLNTFNISLEQYDKVKIPIVIRVKDENLFPAKYLDKLEIGRNLLITALSGVNTINDDHIPTRYYTVSSYNQSLSGYDGGGYFKGYIQFDIGNTSTVQYVYLSAYATLSGYGVITGGSNEFNINPCTGKYDIAKINENVDYKEKFKAFRFQEHLLDKDIFFDHLLGTAVGTLTSNPDTLGKRTHEKISNFVDNNINIDTCNVQALLSIAQHFNLDISQFERSRFNTPPNFARLIDLLSIKQSKLWGERNVFRENFNTFNTCSGNSIYGVNIGAPLDIGSTILTAGDNAYPIVAKEKFSGEYKLINTDILSSSNVEIRADNTYPLSAYNNYWGWGLVLPTGVSGIDIQPYYEFYEYVYRYNNTQLEGIINWDDQLTTISETQSSRNNWIESNGTIETLLSYALLKGLGLIDDCDNLS